MKFGPGGVGAENGLRFQFLSRPLDGTPTAKPAYATPFAPSSLRVGSRGLAVTVPDA